MYLKKSISHIAWYGLALAFIIFMLKWLHWQFIVLQDYQNTYGGIIALSFTLLGFWLAYQFLKTGVHDRFNRDNKSVNAAFTPNKLQLQSLKLTTREFEILELIAEGCSNAEIASRLYLSVSTIKTHVSNLYQKLDVNSRFKAIAKARNLGIVE